MSRHADRDDGSRAALEEWPEQGRVGRVVYRANELHLLFLYRDVGDDMWTYFLVPSTPGYTVASQGPDFYVQGTDAMRSIPAELDVEWVTSAEEESELERRYFGLRPLVEHPGPMVLGGDRVAYAAVAIWALILVSAMGGVLVYADRSYPEPISSTIIAMWALLVAVVIFLVKAGWWAWALGRNRLVVADGHVTFMRGQTVVSRWRIDDVRAVELYGRFSWYELWTAEVATESFPRLRMRAGAGVETSPAILLWGKARAARAEQELIERVSELKGHGS